jgi:hypothetical protein
MMPAVRKVVSLGVLVLAAAAAPARAAVPLDVYMGPIPVRGYEMTIVASPKDSGGPAAVYIALDRDAGKRFRLAVGGRQFRQEHSFLADERGVHVQIAANFQSATVRADLGRYGRVDLAVTAPLANDPDPCLPTSGQGIATGDFVLRPGGRYFGTIRRRRIPAIIDGGAACARDRVRATASASHIELTTRMSSKNRAGRIFGLARSRHGMFIFLIRAGFRVFVQDTIEELSPPPLTLSVAPNLSGAKLFPFGPFVSGVGVYAASSPAKYGRSTGTLSGSLTALFDTPGPLALSRRPVPAELGRIPGPPPAIP